MLPTDEAGTVGLLDGTGDELVIVEQAGDRAMVTLNDAVTRDASSQPLAASLHQTLRQLVAVAELRAIVLTGVEDAFSSGVDGPETAAGWPEGSPRASNGAVRSQLGEVARLIAHSDVPFIAAVNGVAAGAGLALALTCDVVILSDQARLAPGAGRVGLLSEVGMSWLLTRQLGYDRTVSLFRPGYELTAAQALRAGLVDAVVERDELAFAISFWCEISALAATRGISKRLVRSAADSSQGRATVMGEFAA
ncbi:MAG: enoyl-CoA hydratase/isomerase family protein [Acidimicrobiales bacterium]|nr:enoyl-CoA hydratase/isomerase family protein [Acidimicrobiales bacterium]MBO0892776.1 enoyl-CoA hydratase/isomerase family protein [Acidimicrobiales bacterium]